MTKHIIMIQAFGGVDGLGMIYDLDMYEGLKQDRPKIIPKKESLIPLGFDNLALHPNLPKLAEHLSNGDGAILYNIGVMKDKNNSIRPSFIGSHHDMTEQVQGLELEGKQEINTSGYFGRCVEKIYGAPTEHLVSPLINVSGHAIIQRGKNEIIQMGKSFAAFDIHRPNSEGVIAMNRLNQLVGEANNPKYDLVEKALDTMANNIQSITDLTVPIEEYNYPIENENFEAIVQILENSDVYGHTSGNIITVFPGVSSGWDSHGDQVESVHDVNFPELDKNLHNFILELKSRDLWNKVTIVFHSEFGRTTRNNGISGTDHGWGTFTFILGGDVDGGKMIGKKLEYGGPQFEGTNLIIPEISYDQLFASMMRWFGLSMDDTLDCLMSPEGSFEKTLPVYGYSEDLISGGGEPDLNYKIYGEDGYLNDGDTIDYEEVTLMLEEGTDVTKYILNGNTFNMDGELSHYLELKNGENSINVIDKDGNNGKQFKITMKEEIIDPSEENITPKAIITGSRFGVIDEELVFRGDSSFDPDGIIVEYIWNLDGVERGKGMILNLTLEEAKIYNLSLKVIDNQGGDNEKEFSIMLFPPNLKTLSVIKAPISGRKEENIEFDGTMSETSQGEIIDYIWEIEGEEYIGDEILYVFFSSGLYEVKLKVIDSKGGENISSFKILIEE